MKTIHLALIVAAALPGVSLAQAPIDPGAANVVRPTLGATPREGFTMRGADAMMTRGGVTTKIQSEVTMPNGLRVQANGNVTLRDGTPSTLQTNRLLTFEGAFEDVAMSPQGTVPLSSTTPNPTAKTDVGISARDGISVSGAEVFITRNGTTERLSKEMKLPNGAMAKPDGTITTHDGKTMTLKANQILDLNGMLQDAPTRPNPAGPAPGLSIPQ